MSSSLDLNLDFQDYTPRGGQEDFFTNNNPSSKDEPMVQIKIPDDFGQSQSSGPSSGPSGLGKTFQSLIQNVTGSSSMTMSEESLRNLTWASNRMRQQQQPLSQASGDFNWGLNYFSQYFDVDTDDVIERILWSAIPLRKTGLDFDNLGDKELIAPLAAQTSTSDMDGEQMRTFSGTKQRSYSYMERFIQSRPDLYGPFWVSATLVFAIAIFANIASFLNHRSKVEVTSSHINAGANLTSDQPVEFMSNQIGSDLDSWHYSIDELNIMSTVIMVYVTILPTFLWFLFWFRGCTKYYTLTETICAYGYSLSIFIPLSLLLTIQTSIFRYLVLALGATLSGIVLTLSFLPIVRSDPHLASSHIMLAIVPLCHFGLAYVIHRVMLL